MARAYEYTTSVGQTERKKANYVRISKCVLLSCFFSIILNSLIFNTSNQVATFVACIIPAICIAVISYFKFIGSSVEELRAIESELRGGKDVLGMPPKRDAFDVELENAKDRGKKVLDKYLVGFEVESGDPIWIKDEDLCSHGCVFAKTGVGKTLWMEGLIFQQMNRGRASGLTFIDAKRDPGTLAEIILMASMTNRLEDLVVIDPFDPVCAYNFVFTAQKSDVKARKVLRSGLPPVDEASPAKHYERLASQAIGTISRALDSLNMAWSIKDVAAALYSFERAYPILRDLAERKSDEKTLKELSTLASTYRNNKNKSFDSAKITENLRGIATELNAIADSEAGNMFCISRADLNLTDAVLRGKIVYYMTPRLEDAESAERVVRIFREDLEASIGEITSNPAYNLEDPHMVMVDEGASTFSNTWANLFELARKGRFAILFGAQSISGLMDRGRGLSEEFYQRVIANVNLKVIMRLGDNKTAEDMSEWIGKIVKDKKSYGVAYSSGVSHHELTKHFEFNRRSNDSYRDNITIAEDEDDLVSQEELKHEMSSEKGLAWFDIGDGKLRKGRSIWFDADFPKTFEVSCKDWIVRYPPIEGCEIGLSNWVDKKVLKLEQEAKEKEEGTAATQASPAQSQNHSSGGSGPSQKENESSNAQQKPDSNTSKPGPFKLGKTKPGKLGNFGRVTNINKGKD